MTQNQTSTLVNWTGYVAATLLLVLPLSVLTVRSGAWQQGLLLYALGCAGAALVLLLSLLLLILPRFRTQRRAIIARAVPAVPGTLLLLLLLGSGGDVPPIHDITTDAVDPPQFSVAPERRGRNSNSLAIKPDVIDAQLVAYPDVTTLVSADGLEASFAHALEVARELGWDVYREDLNAGYIEAVDTTRVMGFKDDIVIRIRTNGDGTIVDLRSVSRVGRSDLGANAARIRRFAEAFGQ